MQLRTLLIIFCCFLNLLLSAQALENLDEMVGYANTPGEGLSTTTGGQGGSRDTLTTLSELKAYAKNREKETSPGILYISGKITSASTETIVFKHGANLSIFGIDNAELKNIGIRIWDYHNTVIRNLTIHEVFYPDDALSIEDSHHVWVDHCELYSINEANTGTDTYDGLLDIKKGSKNITISWCKLHDHIKCMLIGHTDNANQGVEDREMTISIHHNYFYKTDGRNPSLRHGSVHLYNNYFKDITDYGIAVRQSGHALIENNHYENVKIPIITNKFKGPDGFVCESGNSYSGNYDEGDNVITQNDCDFWNDLPYTYDLDPLEIVINEVIDKAGVFGATTSIVNGYKNKTLNISPNPVLDQISFDKLNISGHFTIEIFEVSGRRVFQKKNVKGVDLSLSTSKLGISNGLYLVRLSKDKLVYLGKFIKL